MPSTTVSKWQPKALPIAPTDAALAPSECLQHNNNNKRSSSTQQTLALNVSFECVEGSILVALVREYFRPTLVRNLSQTKSHCTFILSGCFSLRNTIASTLYNSPASKSASLPTRETALTGHRTTVTYLRRL